jgi:hypothetical protein
MYHHTEKKQWIVESLTPDAAAQLVNTGVWDAPFRADSERFLLVKDATNAEGSAQFILSISGTICENITLLKNDGKMLNFVDLVRFLEKLPLIEYSFWSERRLGNKYKFITDLMGGSIQEENGNFRYIITARIARRRLYMRELKKWRYEYSAVCTNLQNILTDDARRIFVAIQQCIKNLPPALRGKIDEASIQKQFDRYITEAQTILTDTVNRAVNESNDECVKLLDNPSALDRFIKDLIDKTVKSYITELSHNTEAILAHLEYTKSVFLEKERSMSKNLQWHIETMQSLFYKPAPFAECFMQMNLLYYFLHNNEMPKMQIATCNGCQYWNCDKKHCSYYKCAVSDIPFGCKHWSVKPVKPTQPASPKPASQIIRSKCGGCIYFTEDRNFCTWIKTEINELIAGCAAKKSRLQKNFCNICGKKLDSAYKFCPKCGKKIYPY